ncbi:alpha/beta hydrolase BEM46/Esterase/lipase/thioesterase [Polychaeton citri CBS 116435]|uniref:Alpha/beta hydrolase BEM46/Esterase/lipase/thioesterase n=1 Tax=Polychaeton citri CBS 116435 TaxID=1314669 RepID=A0A9P4QDU1_9PEZI|nr:alpha/beta hydrolase BEM46/Esterase/lipase/thioesterase [Polychaeton citri CBS 116435]
MESISLFWPYMKWPVYVTSFITAVFGSALYYYQNEIIYPRGIPPGSRTDVPRPQQFGMEDHAEELMLSTPDGERISAFLLKPPNKLQAKPVTMISFHGNAGNIGHRLPIGKILANDLQCTVLMLEYRGYGLSSGTPNEEGLKVDAQTGLDYIRSREDLQNNKIVIYGQSLGGAVSIDLVARNAHQGDIKGLILENTFTSIAELIPSALPIAKYLAPLCHQYWRSEQTLPQITNVPILFLSGLLDEIVPPSHMKKLFRSCRAKVCIWKELPHGDHNNSVAEQGYFLHIDDFIDDHVLERR